MSSVENRVVSMQFDNKDFASKIADTMVSLQKLDEALQFSEGKQGIADLGQSVNNVNFSGMEAGIETIKNRFSTFGIVGMTVIQNLTNGIIGFAKSLGSKAISGGITRSMNLEKADFMLQNIVQDSKAVEAIMTDVDNSVKGTAYSLDQAALVAAQFAATGMRSGDQLRTILKGVTGIASTFGADYQRVGEIFTQISAQGRVYANDLNSLATMGVNAKAALVDYFKEVKKQSGVTTKDIDDMVKKGEIDFKTFGNAMSHAFGDSAKEANRTFTGAMSNVNAALGRIGADFITPFIKTKKAQEEAKKETYNLVDVLNSFRNVLNSVKDVLTNSGVYEKWASGINGASKVVVAFLDLLNNDLQSLAGNGKEASKTFVDALKSLQDALGLSNTDFGNLRSTVNGVFAVFRILYKAVSGLLGVFLPMGNSLQDAGSGFLAITGAIGRYLIGLEEAINESKIFEKLFSGVSFVVNNVAGAISYLAGKFKDLFSGLGGGNGGFLKTIANFIDYIEAKLKPLGGIFQKTFGGVRDIIDGIFDGLGKALNGANFDKIFSLLNLGVSGGIGFSFIEFLKNLNGTLARFADVFSGKSLMSGSSLDRLIVTLQSGLGELSKSVRADVIMKIAKAIAVLAGSIFLLSIIEPGRLFIALAGMQALLYDLGKIIEMVNKISGDMKNTSSFVAIGASLGLISTGLLIMAAAVKVLSTMSLGDLAKGLGSVFGLLAAIEIFMTKASGLKGRNMKKVAKALVPISVAMLILSQAVKQLAALNLKELAKGIGGIGVLLVELAVFMKLTGGLKVKGAVGLLGLSAALLIISKVVKEIGSLNPENLAKGLVGLGFVLLELAGFIKLMSKSKGIVKASAGMYILAKAMESLTSSLKVMGDFSEEQLAKGLLSLGGSLIIIAGAMRLMPSNMVTASAGLFIAALAIQEIASAMSSMGGMNEAEMVKSLVELGGALGILAIAMKAMNSSISGAAALLVVSAALSVLAPVLLTLGSMSLEQIVNSLLSLAGAFVIIGVAGAVLGPLAGTIALLGASIALFGIGLLSAGAGVMLFVAALKLLSDGIGEIVLAIPVLLQGIIDFAPQVGFAGVMIVISLLKAISDNIGKFTEAAINLVVNFVNAISSKLDDIIDAGMNLAISFINGIASGIDEHGGELRAAIGNLIGSLINFVLDSLQGLVELIPVVGGKISKGIEGVKKDVDNFFGDGTVSKNTKEEMGKVNDTVGKETKSAANSANKNLAQIPSKAKKSAKQTANSFKGTGKSIKNEAKGIPQAFDLTKPMKNNGAKSIEAYTKKFASGAKKKTGSDAANKIKGGVESVSYGPAATNGFDGFSNTWLSKDWYGLGAKAADEKNRGFKEHDKQHSPSKLWAQFAEYDYLGYYNNMKHLLSKFAAAGGMMADAIHKPFEDSMHRLSLNFDSIDTTPTIRPVLDLSNIKMGASAINSMLTGSSYALQMAGSIDVRSKYDSMLEQNDIQAKNIQKIADAIEDKGLDVDLIYNAIREGAADATISLSLNSRELTRGLKDMGVKFR